MAVPEAFHFQWKKDIWRSYTERQQRVLNNALNLGRRGYIEHQWTDKKGTDRTTWYEIDFETMYQESQENGTKRCVRGWSLVTNQMFSFHDFNMRQDVADQEADPDGVGEGVPDEVGEGVPDVVGVGDPDGVGEGVADVGEGYPDRVGEGAADEDFCSLAGEDVTPPPGFSRPEEAEAKAPSQGWPAVDPPSTSPPPKADKGQPAKGKVPITPAPRLAVAKAAGSQPSQTAWKTERWLSAKTVVLQTDDAAEKKPRTDPLNGQDPWACDERWWSAGKSNQWDQRQWHH